MLSSSIVAVALLIGGQAYAQPSPQSSTRPPAQAAVVVNLNTATASELQALPGIGVTTAARILEYRQKNGPFRKIEEIMNVEGIGEKIFLRLKAQLSVGTPSAAVPQN
jgi:competence protein ComEA